MTNNYQEPIEQKDLELERKIHEEVSAGGEVEQKETIPTPEAAGETQAETGAEAQEEKVSEQIETARQAISTQPAAPAASVSGDMQSVADIQEFEKKVEKLVEMAVQKGPEYAIQVAQQMDKGKNPSTADNYALDEIHDRLIEEELRKQLIAKGLLKEL